MKSSEIRRLFLEFFRKRGHEIIPSASLVTTDEQGVTNATLFNTAGMQPLVPYLLGKPYVTPDGREVNRLADVQKCLRTTDLDDVGDNRHLTFFEMMGNWSLGDYFKKDAIEMSYKLLTDKEEGFGLDKNRLYVTVFEGNDDAPRDEESAKVWESVGMPKNRIYFKDASANWWPAVKGGKDDWTGPTGPCSEMFYDITPEGLGDLSPEEYDKADEEGKVVEIWNDVFMEYEKQEGRIVGKLAKKNVDTGAGLERLCAVIQKKSSVFETDLFEPLMDAIRKESKNYDERSARIYADHIRAATFLIIDGVTPSNTDRGYILRRLLRRIIRRMHDLDLHVDFLKDSIGIIDSIYSNPYPDIAKQRSMIETVILDELDKFSKPLSGLEQYKIDLEAARKMPGKKIKDKPILDDKDTASVEYIYQNFQTYGVPADLSIEAAKKSGFLVDENAFKELMTKHQSLSRAGAEQKFKGGLADPNDPMVVRYHTATHLLHQALHDIYGENDGGQKGSNITAERLRFDFAHDAKMTDEEKRRVEDIVNEKISAALPVNNIVLPKEEAEKTGARHFFGEKYGNEVSVYFIGPAGNPPSVEDIGNAYSKEFCGGPHVANTSELAGPEGKWRFKITKEEAVAKGTRRIKAVLA